VAEFIEALRVTNAAVFTLLAAASFVHWRRRGGEAAGWLVASFGVLALVVVEGLILPQEGPRVLEWVRKATVAVALLFPYFLYRFTSSFGRTSRRVDVVAHSLTALVVAGALLLPSISGPEETRPAAVQAFTIAVLVQWAGLSLVSAWRLWRAGRAQPTPARRRMRLLSLAAIGLSAGIVVAGLGASGGSVVALIVQFLALVSAVLFFLGFAPPRVLRLAWRQREEEEFQGALGDLMTATRAEEVASRLLPHVTDIVAGQGAALLDEEGTVIGWHGDVPENIRLPEHRVPAEHEPGVVRLPMRSGSLLVWASRYSPFFAREELELLTALGNLADLALTRARLGERANQLAQVVNFSHDAIISKDLDGTITSWNRGAEDVYGYSEDEAVGRPISMLVPDDRADEIPTILERITRGERIDHFETLRRRGDGRVIAVSLSISPVRDADGKVVGAATIARDVTEREQAEQIIRDQAALLDLAQDAIVARGLDGRINYWNRGAVDAYGFSKAEALGSVTHELLRTGFPRPRAEVEAAVLGEGRWEGELIQTRRDGSQVPVSSRWTLQTDGGGEPLQVLEVHSNIAEQKAAAHALQAAKEEAERANLAKSDFLSRMSHELRTPLNAILGFGQLLEMDHLNGEQKEGVQHILKAGRHLLDLINEVLDIARIESGRLPISLEPVRMDEAVAEAFQLIAPLAAERTVTVQNPPDCDDHVLADRQRLKQVLLNLLSNAVKYNREGGTVTLSYQKAEGGWLRVAIEDTGGGIDPADLHRLFTPFERLGAEQTGVEGTGIGLALSKRLVDLMGGQIGVESQLGVGSTFWVQLPLVESPVEELERVAGGLEAPSRRTDRKRKILYIEDNLSNLRLIERVMAHRPTIEVLPAMLGGLGLDLAREHHPDLILLDLHLPDMLGHEVLDRLRGNPETATIPVVVISADATPGQVRRLLSAGAADYLTKPLDVARLLQVVDDTMDGKEA
jgi:PAS domain S-box-containing protein